MNHPTNLSTAIINGSIDKVLHLFFGIRYQSIKFEKLTSQNDTLIINIDTISI